MVSCLKQLDDLLRGRKTVPERLIDGRIDLPLRMFVPLALVLGAAYGFFMGWYAILGRGWDGLEQLIASTVKLPGLFLLTLVVTFPSLYVFNALVGCRLSFGATMRLLVGAIVVNVAVAASFGPILWFFTLNTTSYSFIILLNVALLSIGGAVGLGFLLHTLRRLVFTPPISPPPPPPMSEPVSGAEGGPCAPGETADAPLHGGSGEAIETPTRELGPLDRLPGDVPGQALGQARMIFRIWVVIYGLVGAQMGWLLRPFVGSPDLQFTWFRHRESNFFQAVFQHIQGLFTG